MSSGFRVRLVEPGEDYALLDEWWAGHAFPPVPRAALPRLGVMVERTGEAVAACWLMMDNSTGLGVVVWPVTRPGLAARTAAAALSTAIDFLKGEAVANGYRHLFSTCTQKGLSKLLVRQGFEVIDRNVTHHFWEMPNDKAPIPK